MSRFSDKFFLVSSAFSALSALLLSKFFPLFCVSLSRPQISPLLLSFDNHIFRTLMLTEQLPRAELFRCPIFLICIVLLFCSSQVLNTLCALIFQAIASRPKLFSIEIPFLISKLPCYCYRTFPFYVPDNL